MTWPHYRTVVLDDRAQQEVDRERHLTARFDDQWRGIEWKLSHAPGEGSPRVAENTTQDLVYVYPANAVVGTRAIAVLYSYNEDTVTVHAVLVMEAEPEAATPETEDEDG